MPELTFYINVYDINAQYSGHLQAQHAFLDACWGKITEQSCKQKETDILFKKTEDRTSEQRAPDQENQTSHSFFEGVWGASSPGKNQNCPLPL